MQTHYQRGRRLMVDFKTIHPYAKFVLVTKKNCADEGFDCNECEN